MTADPKAREALRQALAYIEEARERHRAGRPTGVSVSLDSAETVIRNALVRSLPDSGAGREGLDVERLVRAMEDVFPGWLEEAPGTAEAQAEMRSYAEQLDVAYRRLADSASPPAALGAGREGLREAMERLPRFGVDVENVERPLVPSARGVLVRLDDVLAALGAGSTDEVRRLLDEANNVVNTEWANGNVSHGAEARILNGLNIVRAALTDKPSEKGTDRG